MGHSPSLLELKAGRAEEPYDFSVSSGSFFAAMYKDLLKNNMNENMAQILILEAVSAYFNVSKYFSVEDSYDLLDLSIKKQKRILKAA